MEGGVAVYTDGDLSYYNALGGRERTMYAPEAYAVLSGGGDAVIVYEPTNETITYAFADGATASVNAGEPGYVGPATTATPEELNNGESGEGEEDGSNEGSSTDDGFTPGGADWYEQTKPSTSGGSGSGSGSGSGGSSSGGSGSDVAHLYGKRQLSRLRGTTGAGPSQFRRKARPFSKRRMGRRERTAHVGDRLFGKRLRRAEAGAALWRGQVSRRRHWRHRPQRGRIRTFAGGTRQTAPRGGGARASRLGARRGGAENAPLRALVSGRLRSLPEDAYDVSIRRALAEASREFREGRLLGDLLGRYALGVSDGWLAMRIEDMVQSGELAVVREAEADRPYSRVLRRA